MAPVKMDAMGRNCGECEKGQASCAVKIAGRVCVGWVMIKGCLSAGSHGLNQYNQMR